jgi:hypothetical protein
MSPTNKVPERSLHQRHTPLNLRGAKLSRRLLLLKLGSCKRVFPKGIVGYAIYRNTRLW